MIVLLTLLAIGCLTYVYKNYSSECMGEKYEAQNYFNNYLQGNNRGKEYETL